jgi:hypothetical protein
VRTERGHRADPHLPDFKDPNPGVVVHAPVPNPERRLEYSSRRGEQGERREGDARGVVELRLGEKCARVGCALRDFFFQSRKLTAHTRHGLRLSAKHGKASAGTDH